MPRVIRTLILSGRNNHDWRTTTPYLRPPDPRIGFAQEPVKPPSLLGFVIATTNAVLGLNAAGLPVRQCLQAVQRAFSLWPWDCGIPWAAPIPGWRAGDKQTGTPPPRRRDWSLPEWSHRLTGRAFERPRTCSKLTESATSVVNRAGQCRGRSGGPPEAQLEGARSSRVTDGFALFQLN
jgi:hypothetical protein